MTDDDYEPSDEDDLAFFDGLLRVAYVVIIVLSLIAVGVFIAGLF